MSNKGYAFAVLVLVALVTLIPACGPSSPTPATEAPPPAVTPQAPATSPPQETPPSPPTDTPPPPTDTPLPEATATDTPEPTDTPTATSRPAAPAQPRTPESEGPLDFVEPEWLYTHEQLADGNVKVILKIEITGGAPPFRVLHDGSFNYETEERTSFLEFFTSGCNPIARTITVESADGQSATHDYWLGKEKLDWCKE